MYPQTGKPPDLDEQFKPVLTKPPDLDDTGVPVEEEPSTINKVWQMMNTAPKFITDQTRVNPEHTITEGKPLGGITEIPGALLDILKNAFTNPSTIPSMVKGFGQGAIEGAGEMASPVNIADMLTGTSKKPIMQLLNRGVSALTAGGGVSDLMEGNTLQAIPEMAFGAMGMARPGGISPKISNQIINPQAIDDPLENIMDMMARKSSQRMADAAPTMENMPRGNGMLPPELDMIDPNIRGGMGNPEMAGSAPMSRESAMPMNIPEEKPPTVRISQLPADLRNAKPRFNMGQKSYTPQFENDLDKALFIIAQKSPSKRDADYLKFVMDEMGVSEPVARQLGSQARDMIKTHLANADEGDVSIPDLQLPGKKVASKAVITPEKIGLLNKPGTAIIIKTPDPETIKRAMQNGYRFDSVRDDGSFRMVKTDTPVKGGLPVLEQETNRPTARPTPANAARMGMGEPPIVPPAARILDEGGGLPPKKNIGMNDILGAMPKTKMDYVKEAFNFPRAVMASLDFSAPLRQGLPLIHKKQFWTSLDDMFKSWGSEKAYNMIQEGIQERPLFKPKYLPGGKVAKSFAEEAGLRFTDLHSLDTREENLMSSWAEKIPGVRRSNRAYTAFLNKLRADTFEDLITRSKVFGVDGTTNLPLARELAEFVNVSSGRGSLGRLEKSASTLNTGLFSPRLIASRLTMLNPRYYINANPVVRKEALKSLFAIAAVGSTVTQLGKLAGGEVENDPNSSDYGKLKIGNVRLDPYGGFQQYIVAAQRLLRPNWAKVESLQDTDTGITPLDMAAGALGSGGMQTKSSVSGRTSDLLNPTGPYDPTHMDIIARFGRSKLHPVLGFLTSMLMGQKEMTGQKMDFTTMNPMDNAVTQRFIPIFLQDLYQLAKEDPSLLPIIGPLTGAGMSSQIYGGEK